MDTTRSNFKTVWASVIPAPVGSTPLRPRHPLSFTTARSSLAEEGKSMHRRIMALLLIAVLLVVSSPSASLARVQDQDVQRDIAEAGATAEELFALAADRKFNALYDRIHPDAQAIVPRAAAVGAFTEIYAAAQAGRAEVRDVQIGQWTWGVTDQTYDAAAQVRFVQPFVDENGQERLLEDRMYLVESDGEWRWFFGSNPEFVEEVITQYGGEA